ncbi:Calx-beta domain-containing protein [Laspinema palackyanum]|uniref:Calx-beta domain-containing protein n=1 Tax=Laspinema palackyanum TaxID=3231601 RepID=UPI00345C7C67|nr:hypothetical protein [Laspinema sp. D2c]
MAPLLGSDKNDTLTGTPEIDSILGFSGDDILEGFDGDDRLNGNQGNDTVFGGNGNDIVRGGKDGDRLFGTLGDDTCFGDLGNDTLFGGDGNDFLIGDQGPEANFGGDGSDFLGGELGNDTLLGLAGEDSLDGGEGADELNGNRGNDTVIGGAGNDILRGGKDNDLVMGGLGDDRLYGDIGIDTLTGAEGNDTFFLRKNLGGTAIASADVITDFTDGIDKIALIEGLTFTDLELIQGTENNSSDVLLRDKSNGQFLAVLQSVDLGTLDAEDFINLATLNFSDSNFSVNEDGTTEAAVTVTRNGGEGTVGVTISASSNEAIALEDYDNTPVLINFAPGETQKTVTIPIVNDPQLESTESLYLTLLNPTGEAVIGIQNTAVLDIIDDDTQLPKLTFRNPNPTPGDNFGAELVPLGQNLFIGAPGKNSPNAVPGVVYWFDGTTGELLQTFNSPTSSVGDRFGISIAAQGNLVLIGAPRDATGGLGSGIAYLFDVDTGAVVQTLRSPSPNPGDSFGFSVAFIGNNLLIGDGGVASGNQSGSGAAYLFDPSGNLLQTFLNPEPYSLDGFGQEVAALGNNALIAAPFDDGNGFNSGRVYLLDPATGALLQTFNSPAPNQSDAFGVSLAPVGNRILVGAEGADLFSGAAYLIDGSTGEMLLSFSNPSSESYEGFGTSVAAIADNFLIGAPGVNPSTTNEGSAYLFDGTTGELVTTFRNPFPERTEGFGAAVTGIGDSMAIAAPGWIFGSDPGEVYLF